MRRLATLLGVVVAMSSLSGCVALANLCGTCCLSCANGGGPVPEDQRLPEPSALVLTGPASTNAPATEMAY